MTVPAAGTQEPGPAGRRRRIRSRGPAVGTGPGARAVRQREREIAVRMAIGAEPRQITRLFVRQGLIVLSAGLVLGLLGSLGAGRMLESQLFGVAPRDPLSLVFAVATFAAAGVLAVWWPARRAAVMDPAGVLKDE